MTTLQHHPAADATRKIRKQLQKQRGDIARGLRAMFDRTLEQSLPQIQAHALEGRGFTVHIIVCNPDGTAWRPEEGQEGQEEQPAPISSGLVLVKR